MSARSLSKIVCYLQSQLGSSFNKKGPGFFRDLFPFLYSTNLLLNREFAPVYLYSSLVSNRININSIGIRARVKN